MSGKHFMASVVLALAVVTGVGGISQVAAHAGPGASRAIRVSAPTHAISCRKAGRDQQSVRRAGGGVGLSVRKAGGTQQEFARRAAVQ